MIKKLQNQSLFETKNSNFFENNIFVSYRRNKGFRKRENHLSFEDRMKIVVEGQGSTITISEICAREGITPLTFHLWTKDFLTISNHENHVKSLGIKNSLDVEKLKVVIEGKTGETSIAQICKRENITQNTYLKWSTTFLNLRRQKLSDYDNANNPIFQKNKELISGRIHEDVFKYFENYLDFSSYKTVVILNSNSRRLDYMDDLASLVSLQKINDVRYINKYFEKINSKLKNGGIFIGCLETFSARRNRKKINNIPVLSNLYFGIEFFFKRILPKLSFTKKYYFDITKGNDRLLSKAEGLGRLVSCGFSIMDFKSINNMLYFVVKKTGGPNFDTNPSYGPIYKMSRLGKNGEIIGVYKFRTMHPYSEYLQDYIVSSNGYSKTGKPAEDFRIPAWGKFMRRFWIDELPQLYNVLKGELKLVGIRPVSQRYFQDIPKEMQKLRLTQKPGCIPPYVALNREGNVMSVLQSEKEYLEEKISNPFFTDTRYFFKAIYNILFNHMRSA